MYDLNLQADQIIKETQQNISQYNANCFFSPWPKYNQRCVLKHSLYPSPNRRLNFTLAERNSYSGFFLITTEANKRINHLFNSAFTQFNLFKWVSHFSHAYYMLHPSNILYVAQCRIIIIIIIINITQSTWIKIQQMQQYAVNKYLHTVASVGFLFTLNYDARNRELEKAQSVFNFAVRH